MASVFESDETIKGWDDDYYHPISVRYYDEAIANMLRRMGAKAGDAVLDAGCGPGVHSIRAASYGCTVIGVDRSAQMLSHAQQRASEAGVSDRIQFIQADLTKLSLGRKFGLAFCWGVIIHIPDVEAVLDGLADHIAPSGKLAVQLLNRHSLDFTIERLLRKALRKPLPECGETPFGLGNWYATDEGKLWVLRFDTSELNSAMERRGFKLVECRTAEFTEMHRRVGGILRRVLLRFNRFAYRHRLAPFLSCTQILIFDKVP